MQTQLPTEEINGRNSLSKSVFTMTSNSVKRQLNADEMMTPVKRKKASNGCMPLQDDVEKDGSVPQSIFNLTQHECEVMTSYIDLFLDNQDYNGTLLKEAFEPPYGIKRGFTGTVRSSTQISGHICLLCQEEIEEYAGVVFNLRCGHFYHENCADNNRKTCQLCKRGALGDDRLSAKMSLDMARELMYHDPENRQAMVKDLELEKKFVDSLSDVQFYVFLNLVIFERRLPRLHSVKYQRRAVHEKPYVLLNRREVCIYVQPCEQKFRREQICRVALDIYRERQFPQINHVENLITQVRDALIFF